MINVVINVLICFLNIIIILNIFVQITYVTQETHPSSRGSGWELPPLKKITLKRSKIYNRLYFIKYPTVKREKPTLNYNFYLVLSYMIQLL